MQCSFELKLGVLNLITAGIFPFNFKVFLNIHYYVDMYSVQCCEN